MKQVTIYSDGTGHGTHIVDEDGNEIRGISGLYIHIEANDVARVTFDLLAPAVSTKAYVEEVTFRCPFCNESHQHECEKEIGQTND